VRTKFRCYNLVVLRCTIVGRTIGEQRGYGAGISFGLVAHHKFMLCQPLLGGFRTSFPIDHFLILSTVVFSITYISIVSVRINMVKRWCDTMERGSTGERQTSTRWLCTLVEGERATDGESLILF
jgi:hypothetical protein